MKVTDASFKEFIQSDGLVVIDCFATWCGPCRVLSPVIEELAREYSGKVSFGKLDVDENQKVPMQYGIMSIPSLLFFKNGKLVDTVVGAAPKAYVEEKIKKLA